jgi:lysyl-tRNA synthetase class 2
MYDFEQGWLDKLAELRAAGVEPYPNGMAPTHTSEQLHRLFDGVEDPASVPEAADVAVAGRVMFRNRLGKAIFLRVMDRGGSVVIGTDEQGEPIVRHGIVQVYLRREEVGDATFEQIKALDIGDFVWARGHLMRTRTGELSVQAQEARLAGKILNTFPDRFHGLTDVEARSRQRYVDLFMNAETREVFRKRTEIVRYIRRFFEDRDYLEVETPMMQVIPGGATARPFVTHLNALDLPLYLRIAPELYLKRLLVGGLERVFEINRSFRNEGVSVKHNPEFTMMEFYQAWATYHDLMDLTEDLLVGLVEKVCGSMKVQFGPHEIDFTPPFRRADMDELIAEHTGLTPAQLRDPAAMEAFWRANHEQQTGLPRTVGKWWEWLYEAHAEGKLVNPTFVTGFPAEISPLARRNDADPSKVDRFELVIATWEVANAFSELNDPVDQAARFEAQVAARTEGDDEAMYFDEDYIRALSYGMPPAAGQGIGIDRLVMMLTGRTSIREVILFPTLRPRRREGAESE